jgi:acyl-CoA synthetase (AMP-forming)/AMP-acid ligase II
MFETVQQVLRSRMADDSVAMMDGDRSWTWREYLTEAACEASALIAIADPGRPMHVGALLGNSPAMLRSMAAAALGGYVLCGINTTRRGDGLAADTGGSTANWCSPTSSTCRCLTASIWAVRPCSMSAVLPTVRRWQRRNRLCRIEK